MAIRWKSNSHVTISIKYTKLFIFKYEWCNYRTDSMSMDDDQISNIHPQHEIYHTHPASFSFLCSTYFNEVTMFFFCFAKINQSISLKSETFSRNYCTIVTKISAGAGYELNVFKVDITWMINFSRHESSRDTTNARKMTVMCRLENDSVLI